ncbi:MAG: hypothetical protein NTX50_01300 [Candidatus Sumerlaeota bacterium]|nr:hypothetical protein [Candidatus Sumerlaeota bacterium]
MQLKTYIALSPPIYKKESGASFSAKNHEEAVELTRQVAKETACDIIDVHAGASNHPEWFADGVHPTDEGKSAIAKTIAEAIRKKKKD